MEKRIPLSSDLFSKPHVDSGFEKKSTKRGKADATGRGSTFCGHISYVLIDAVDAASLVDHLSELFMSISDLCQEQFSIIRQV